MTPDRWERIKQLFDAARELEGAERRKFVDDVCRGDDSLLAELDSLLSSDDQAGDFLKKATLADPGSTSSGAIPTGIFSAGEVLSGRFQIIRFIGRGGMGEVYEAMDLDLEARIALKTIRSEIAIQANSLTQFKREMQLARRVTHPNVCRMFDLEYHRPPLEVGFSGGVVTFLTMEFLEGETLAARLHRLGRMTMAEAYPLVFDMASALTAAHDVGVIHRDFKPGNVMLVPSKSHDNAMRAVVTDFGLARAVLDPFDQTTRENTDFEVSNPSHIFGTLAYMAPEQLLNHEATAPTDIYGLGLVMYEMVTGRRPFLDDTSFAGVYRRLSQPPPPPRMHAPDLGPEWEEVILRCLQPDPANRFISARDVLDHLPPQTLIQKSDAESVGSFRERLSVFPTAPEKSPEPTPSIAILPFRNLSSDPENDYIGDGLAEELINSLTQIKSLRVVARASCFRFRKAQPDIHEIGQQLNVSTILDGSIRKSGQNLRITAQLINVADGYNLWGNRYDREMKDLFAVQDDIAQAIIRELKVKLRVGTDQLSMKRFTQSVANYNLYLEGRYFWNKRTEQSLVTAIDRFRQAGANDAGFALPLVGLADSYLILGVSGARAPNEVMPLAKEAALQALAIDNTLTEAHTSLACVRALFDWDWREAEAEFRRAIDLCPGYASAHQWYAADLLAPLGRLTEARAEIDLACELDPLSMPVAVSRGLQSYYERDYDRAIGEYLKALALDEHFGLAHYFLGQAYTLKEKHADAVRELQCARELTGGSLEVIAALGHAYAAAGNRDEAMRQLHELMDYSQNRFVSPVLFSQIFVGLQEREAAIEFLEKALPVRPPDFIWIGVRPVFDSIRTDKRFVALCESMGLR